MKTERIVALLAFGVVTASPLSAASPPPSVWGAVDATVRTAMAASETPGISLAIVRDGRVVYTKGYGFRDLAARKLVDPRTVFRFGSVTKEFTAALLVTLGREGKLSLDAPLSLWLPAVNGARDVRLVDLLSQVSGYRDYYPLDYVDREMAKPASQDEIATRYGRFPLTAPPRTRWEYSNTNFLFAGIVAERVTQKSLSSLLQSTLLQPLGMTRTFYDEPYRGMPERATGYDSYFTEPQHQDPFEASAWLNAAGALAGTAPDLARWDVALMDPAGPLAGISQQMMRERVLMPGQIHTHYGLGLDVRVRNGHRIVSHGGNVIGFASSNMMAPDDRTAVVVLTNSYEAPADDIAFAVLSLLIPDLARHPKGGAPAKRRPFAATTAPSQERLIAATLAALRAGTLPPTLADADFLALLDAVNLRRARTTLQRLGRVERISVAGSYPRGGLTVTSATVQFQHGVRAGALYATPQGKVAELFLFR